MHSKTVDLAALARLQERLRAAAARPGTKVHYSQAIEAVAPDIHAARARGCDWDEILAMLAEDGITLALTTLRSYLARISEAGSAGSRQKGRRRDHGADRNRPAAGAAIPVPLRAPIRSAASASTGPAPSTEDEARSPRGPGALVAAATKTPAAPDADGTRVSQDIPSWSFPVRPDTPNL